MVKTEIGGLFPEENNTYDIGYCINKDYWKCGYGSEVNRSNISLA